MIYGLFIITGFGLIALQTAFLPYVIGSLPLFDLVVPLMIYLGLYRSLSDGLLLALICGFLMDGLSGSPYGIYLATYIWLVVGVRGAANFLRVNNLLLRLLIVPAGIAMENAIGIGSAILLQKEVINFAWVLPGLFFQLLWATISGPILLWLFDIIVIRFERWRNARRHIQNHS
jgi:cell shape-determining protein MreD